MLVRSLAQVAAACQLLVLLQLLLLLLLLLLQLLLLLLLLLLLVQLQLLLVLHATPAAGVVAAPAAVWSLPAAADWPASHCQLLLTGLPATASCY